MTIDLALLGKSIEAIRDEQRIQRARQMKIRLAFFLALALVPLSAQAVTFSNEELCRGAHATRNDRNPLDYKVRVVAGSEIHLAYTRSDGKYFEYWCQIGDGEIRVGDPALGWYENSRVYYRIDGRKVEISNWLIPSAEAHRQADALRTRLDNELGDRRTFVKGQLGTGSATARTTSADETRHSDVDEALARQLQTMPGVSRW